MIGMSKTKIVYRDDKTTKIIFGFINSEDSIFVKVIAEDGTIFRLNKNSIVSIKEVSK